MPGRFAWFERVDKQGIGQGPCTLALVALLCRCRCVVLVLVVWRFLVYVVFVVLVSGVVCLCGVSGVGVHGVVCVFSRCVRGWRDGCDSGFV